MQTHSNLEGEARPRMQPHPQSAPGQGAGDDRLCSVGQGFRLPRRGSPAITERCNLPVVVCSPRSMLVNAPRGVGGC